MIERPSTPFVGIAPTPRGYRIVDRTGRVVALGDADALGDLSTQGIEVDDIVGMTGVPGLRGYWIVGANGGVYSFGELPYHGSLPEDGVTTNRIVGIAPSAGGCGYWLADRDGNVYPFGAAPFLGTLAGLGIANGDIVAIAPAPRGCGYWLADRSGGVFTFGKADFHDSLVGRGIGTHTCTAMAGVADGSGYWILLSDGSVYGLGDTDGRLGVADGEDGGASACATGIRLWSSSTEGLLVGAETAVAIAPSARGTGCLVLDSLGRVWPYGDARFHGSARFGGAAAPVSSEQELDDRVRLSDHCFTGAVSSDSIREFAEIGVGRFSRVVTYQRLASIDVESPFLTPSGGLTYERARERVLIRSAEHVDALGSDTRGLLSAAAAPATIMLLERLTGFLGLIPDPYLHEAGPYHVGPEGGLKLEARREPHPLLGLGRRLTALLITGNDGDPARMEVNGRSANIEPGDLIVVGQPTASVRLVASPGGALRWLTWHYLSS